MSSDSPFKSTRSRTRVANQNGNHGSTKSSPHQLNTSAFSQISVSETADQTISTISDEGSSQNSKSEKGMVVTESDTPNKRSSKRPLQLSSSDKTTENLEPGNKSIFKERHSTISLTEDASSEACLFIGAESEPTFFINPLFSPFIIWRF